LRCSENGVTGSLRSTLRFQDPAYTLPEPPAERGPSWLHRWMLAKGLPVQEEPAEPRFVRELFNRAQP